MEGSKPKKYSELKRCPYCKTPLLMAIEVTNKCCWDCHAEGKDIKEVIQKLIKPKLI